MLEPDIQLPMDLIIVLVHSKAVSYRHISIESYLYITENVVVKCAQQGKRLIVDLSTEMMDPL